MSVWFASEGDKVPSFDLTSTANHTGRVATLKSTFGFVEIKRGRRLFFHRSQMADSSEWKNLKVGVQVEFDFGISNDGREAAVNVSIV